MHIESQNVPPIGTWQPGTANPVPTESGLAAALAQVTRPVYLLSDNDRLLVAHDGKAVIGDIDGVTPDTYPLLEYAPPLHPADLGDPAFKAAHGIRYPYVAGAMANGITSVAMVEAMGRAGMIGFFGAGGLTPQRIEEAAVHLKSAMADTPYGFNLIHSPYDTELEAKTAEIYLQHGIRKISASAFLDLTLPLVYYRIRGIHTLPDGRVECPNRVVGKVSRIEVARKFLSPPPAKLVSRLLEQGKITEEEARLAETIPMADDLTAEADSGGHTDNRPALTLFPIMLSLRDELAEQYGYRRRPCIGLGGGIATPESAAAAFAMGAAYILTGSVNQSCVEAGTSEPVRAMLAEARQADVAMAPAADMFEMGVKVQVLKRGTMFAVRAAKLYDLFRRYDRWEEIPKPQQEQLEKNFFKRSFTEEWDGTRHFFQTADPGQIDRAEKDPKHKMALVFRSYLGQSSRWAVTGQPDRKIDYQVWCGPAMGAFNQWVKGSFLEKPENRDVVTVAMNMLHGASVLTRINRLQHSGVPLPSRIRHLRPLKLKAIEDFLEQETH